MSGKNGRVRALDFAWTHEIPEPKSNVVPILKVRPGEKHLVMLVSDSIAGIYTHWADGRTIPCFHDQTSCTGCSERLSRRWEGYLGAFLLGRGLVLLKVTPASIKLAPALKAANGALRFHRLELYRPRYSKCATVQLKLLPRLPDKSAENNLPLGVDIAGALARLWGKAVQERDFVVPRRILDQTSGQERSPAKG